MKIWTIFLSSLFYCAIITSITLISCSKEEGKVYSVKHKIYNRSGQECENQITPEYDILALAPNREFTTLVNTIEAQLDTSVYETIKDEIVNNIDHENFDFTDWLDGYVGNNYSTYFKGELSDLYSFILDNAANTYFDSQVDSLVTIYIQDSNLSLKEINTLATCSEIAKVIWEFSVCEKSELSVRGFDDGMLCALDWNNIFHNPCNLLNITAGILVGWIVGTSVCESAPDPDYNTIILCGVFSGLGGAVLAVLNDWFHCGNIVCDDCHHPSDVSLIYDWSSCKISGAEFFGQFEDAEGWNYEVQVASGTFHGTANIPRVTFPSNFDAGGNPFTIIVSTICDGGNPPSDFNTFYSEQFSSEFPPIPWVIAGPVVADRIHTFRYYSSQLFNNLSTPTWDAEDANTILISYGTQNGLYYADFNFSNVETNWTQVFLTLYDDCVGSYQTRTKSIRLQHE